MGLLDVFNTEEGRLGLGLLSAAAPRSDGANFGQRLSEGVGSVDAWKKQALERDLLKAHATQYQADADAKKLAAQKAMETQAMLKSIFTPPSPGAFTTYGGAGPVMPESARQGGIGAMDINQVAQLKALAGVDLMDAFKWANDPLKLDQGATYRDRITGNQTYMPKIGEGVTMGPGGAIEVPGYGAAMGGIEGAKARATEGAKAGFDVTSYTPAGAANPIQSTRLKDVQRVTGQALPPGGLLPPAQPGVSSGFTGPAEDVLRSIGAIKDPQERSNAMAAYANQMSPNRLQSSAEKITADERAKAAVEAETANTKKGNEYSDFKNQLKYAEKLLNAGPTASWFGNKADQAFGLFGGSSASANLAKELETTSGWLVQNIPKAPGAQSNFELEQYKIQAGDVGNANIPIPQRLASLKAAQKQIDIWEARVKKGEKVDPDYMPPGAKDTPKESLSNLPKASDHKGKKIRDTATGEILVSNGLSWVEAK